MRLRFNIHPGFPIIGHLFYATWGLCLIPFLAGTLKDVLVNDAVFIISAVSAKIGHPVGSRCKKTEPPDKNVLFSGNYAVAHFVNGL
jgi:hypothetical protein